MVQQTCLQCKSIFETEQRYINRGGGKFCCTSCAATHGNKRKRKAKPKKVKPKRQRALVERKCAECGMKFKTRRSYINRGHGRFCGASCAGKYGNRLKPQKRVETACSHCGKILRRKPSQVNKSANSYCNRECKRLAETTGKYDRCEGKRKVTRYSHIKKKKEHIEKLGVICQIDGCTLELHNDPRMVDMHHCGDPEDHNDTKLVCAYHHRLITYGYLKI